MRFRLYVHVGSLRYCAAQGRSRPSSIVLAPVTSSRALLILGTTGDSATTTTGYPIEQVLHVLLSTSARLGSALNVCAWRFFCGSLLRNAVTEGPLTFPVRNQRPGDGRKRKHLRRRVSCHSQCVPVRTVRLTPGKSARCRLKQANGGCFSCDGLTINRKNTTTKSYGQTLFGK
jgi:hypothetical protein